MLSHPSPLILSSPKWLEGSISITSKNILKKVNLLEFFVGLGLVILVVICSVVVEKQQIETYFDAVCEQEEQHFYGFIFKGMAQYQGVFYESDRKYPSAASEQASEVMRKLVRERIESLGDDVDVDHRRLGQRDRVRVRVQHVPDLKIKIAG